MVSCGVTSAGRVSAVRFVQDLNRWLTREVILPNRDLVHNEISLLVLNLVMFHFTDLSRAKDNINWKVFHNVFFRDLLFVGFKASYHFFLVIGSTSHFEVDDNRECSLGAWGLVLDLPPLWSVLEGYFGT